MRLGYDISLSERVKELLDEGTLDKICSQVIVDLEGEWKATLPQDTATRESLYHQIHAMNLLQTRMKAVVNDLLFAEGRE